MHRSHWDRGDWEARLWHLREARGSRDCDPRARFAARFGRHGFPPFGGFGRGFMGGGSGRGGFGRLMADGDLRLVTLALLAEAPRHGYEIIKALEERSSGFYAPSPGVIYPTLTYLEEAGYATSAAEGNKKVFTITEAGEAHLAENREAADAVLTQMERFGRRMNRAREWFDWADGSGDAPPRDRPVSLEELDKGRRRLRALIIDALEGSEDEQKRVAEILNRAADEILRKG